MVRLVNTLSPEDRSPDIGIVGSKALTIAAADFDKYLGQINSTLFTGKEPFFFPMIMDTPSTTYDIALELVDGRTTIITWPSWTAINIRAKRILSAGTTATLVTVIGGQ